jgi:hypothetical protein
MNNNVIFRNFLALWTANFEKKSVFIEEDNLIIAGIVKVLGYFQFLFLTPTYIYI